ncbi:hypothetical protein TVAG_063570 [Trichomonas vaginalis G3]|uniref:CCZ1/INTU/HSP4 first Longin domain-containing protein n=1 Tax=Trichomonas vaginalis (strain ATCC PRA-98 / G3) TaxID=412133 RepID=A2EU27_TRIV3|nr:vacuolar fusion protein CCZ1 homolog-related family [Trichomonas vaginalis G3]EAY03844.1 hypothetical protein TVAG_063570 [Trichomonas vaginalis G3]KAI5487498.1 vacuolar fusion protein CCZ1 homolog-related family [Trichomonas vaginalis G3]|eukprot:XP_001316067.1 hypothetical protein [Trichomonas vaginalis G3]
MSDSSNIIPNLVSFCAFDGIPPQKEGEDPIVFWYYPKETPINDQLNMVGLYLTFLGYTRDFRSSKDCEYFITDKTVCCFAHLGAQLWIAATFSVTDKMTPQIYVQQLNIFKSIFGIIFPPPSRDPETNLLEKNSDFADTFMDLLHIFAQRPTLKRLKPSLELWNACEEALAISKYSMPNIRSASFIYKDRLVHTSMHPNDALAFYVAFRSNVQRLFCFKPEFEQDTFQWLTGLVKMQSQTHFFMPPVTIYEGLVLPAIVRYNELVVFIALLMPKEMTKESLKPLEDSLKELLPNICKLCKKTIDTEQRDNVIAYRNDGTVEITSPMTPTSGIIADDKATDHLVELIGKNESDFSRFVAHIENDRWLFMEKDGPSTTIIDEKQPTLPDAVSNAITYIRLNNLS